MTKWLGWHFSDKTETLRYGDGRKILVGKTHSVRGKLVMCKHGLHASPTVFDALSYAPGLILFRVELGGTILHEEDKSVASRRKYLARLDATEILREYARWCALQVVYLWDCPPVVREWLEMGNPALRSAAESAAGSAAESAAESAAARAARSAAWSAAESAAARAAQGAAESAAWSAWYAADSAAARAARSAAWDAAESAAARAVARVQKRKLEKMVREATGIAE